MKGEITAAIKPLRRSAAGPQPSCATRLECVDLALAFEAPLPYDSASSLKSAGVWTLSAELTGRGQPAGLPEGSRWLFRARGERPPESLVRERAPRRGARATPWSARAGTVAGLAPLPGCRTTPAPLPGGRCPHNPQRPPATVWQPFGLTKAKRSSPPSVQRETAPQPVRTDSARKLDALQTLRVAVHPRLESTMN